jgi:hypothetical protein
MAYNDPRVVCPPFWITAADLCCTATTTTDCDGNVVPLTFPWTDLELIEAASNLLYARTCYRYPGLCQREVWPCIGCHCDCHPCGCAIWRMIEMPTDYPIYSIDLVEIDGVPLLPAQYRLDADRYLVRIDGDDWPSCNNFGLVNPPSSTSEVRVTYTTGRQPPIELRMAAAELVCELRKACEGEPCGLPASVRSIVRRGVEMELHDVTELLTTGLTGNTIIDHALKVHGNCSHQGRLADPTRIWTRGYGVS